ncbi:MAG: hypothetical protein IKK43_05290 [Clostridia bacterium]|nr:hypothetical protein [Clostridia bacterium]
MSGRDIATQIKATFNFRKNMIKNKKRLRILITTCVILIVAVVGITYYSKDIVVEYTEKHEELNIAKNDLEIEKEKVEQEREQVLSEAEIIAQTNLYLVEENIKLQESLKLAASVGVKPQNYDEAEKIESAVDYSKLEYIGEFEGTAYTPSVEECSNNLGYTASGKPIIAGVSIAVDNKYWKLGTKFYIEGLGYVVAMDTGNAVKGKYRFDYAVFDRDYALKLGRRNWDVYLVKE